MGPWINFNGNAEEAFNFYKSVFGGEFTKIIRFKDIASAEMPVNEKEADKIIEKHNSIISSRKDQHIFFDALMHPPKPNANLKKAVAHLNKWLNK